MTGPNEGPESELDAQPRARNRTEAQPAGTIGTLVLGAVRAEIGSSGFGTKSAIPNSLTFVERRQTVW